MHRAWPRGGSAGAEQWGPGELQLVLLPTHPAGALLKAHFLHGKQLQGPGCLAQSVLFSLLDFSGSLSSQGLVVRVLLP